MKAVRVAIDSAIADGIVQGDDVIVGGLPRPLSSVRLVAPCRPTKIVCVGRNYADHARELGNDVPETPLLFFKPPSAVIGPGDSIVYPPQSQRVDYEGELAVVIGRRCRNVRRDEAHKYVRGYTVFNDVTARDLQKADGQWARAKGFDTFAPIGPWIVDGIDVSRLRIRTRLNGKLCQDACTDQMIFDVPTLVEYATAAFTMEPDDIIATGTPSGIGPMLRGDLVEVEIEGIGTLANSVV